MTSHPTPSAHVCTTLPQCDFSVHNFVPSQPLKARAVGLPVGSAGCGNASILVEVYALGVGVTLARQGNNLRSAEGSFELEANGKRFVFEPLRSRKAQWVVAPVQRHVSAIGLALQAVDEHQVAQIGDGLSHWLAPSKAEAVILSLPAGAGKTTMARELAAALACEWIVDEWSPSLGVFPGALHLTNMDLEGGAA